eukprot:3917493-Rhodomonas_salina.2
MLVAIETRTNLSLRSYHWSLPQKVDTIPANEMDCVWKHTRSDTLRLPHARTITTTESGIPPEQAGRYLQSRLLYQLSHHHRGEKPRVQPDLSRLRICRIHPAPDNIRPGLFRPRPEQEAFLDAQQLRDAAALRSELLVEVEEANPRHVEAHHGRVEVDEVEVIIQSHAHSRLLQIFVHHQRFMWRQGRRHDRFAQMSCRQDRALRLRDHLHLHQPRGCLARLARYLLSAAHRAVERAREKAHHLLPRPCNVVVDRFQDRSPDPDSGHQMRRRVLLERCSTRQTACDGTHRVAHQPQRRILVLRSADHEALAAQVFPCSPRAPAHLPVPRDVE